MTNVQSALQNFWRLILVYVFVE